MFTPGAQVSCYRASKLPDIVRRVNNFPVDAQLSAPYFMKEKACPSLYLGSVRSLAEIWLDRIFAHSVLDKDHMKIWDQGQQNESEVARRHSE